MPTVLVVEDDPLIRDILTRRLRIAGYDVIAAGDGLEGVRRAQDDAPDLVLMDIGLPLLNGWLATARLRELDGTRRLPIIALTAYAMAEDRLRSLDAGCDDYLPKPIDFARLLPKIAALLRGSPAA